MKVIIKLRMRESEEKSNRAVQCTMEKLVLSGSQIVETDFFDLYRSGK